MYFVPEATTGNSGCGWSGGFYAMGFQSVPTRLVVLEAKDATLRHANEVITEKLRDREKKSV